MCTNDLRFRVGVSLVLGSIWTSAALGDELFAPAVHYYAGNGPTSVAIGDLDGDQVPDLAVANIYTSGVSVLLGVGDGTFAARAVYRHGDDPISVAIGDLDGDQVPDLAVANSYKYNDVSVLLGVGDGTFADAVYYAAGNGPRSVAIGDLDGNQAPDLVVANQSTDNVSVLLNQSPPIPGDLNGDGCVDQIDLGLLLAYWGWGDGGDCDNDGDTDQADLGILLANWGEGCG